MKIVLPTDLEENKVCPAFGRAPYFTVKDTETGKKTLVENPAAQAEGGAGVKAAQAVLDLDAAVVLTPRLGENSAEVFTAAGVKIYRTVGDDVEKNLEDFAAGTLLPLTHFHQGYHGIK